MRDDAVLGRALPLDRGLGQCRSGAFRWSSSAAVFLFDLFKYKYLIGLIYVKIQNLICKFVAFCPHIIHHSKFYQNQTQADRDETVYVKIDRRQLTQSTHKLHCKAVREAPLNPSLLLCPRPVGGGAGALRGHRRPSSVCPSDVAYIGSNSKTKKPRKTKLCTGVPQVTCDSHTDFKVKRSKVKVTGQGHIAAAT